MGLTYVLFVLAGVPELFCRAPMMTSPNPDLGLRLEQPKYKLPPQLGSKQTYERESKMVCCTCWNNPSTKDAYRLSLASLVIEGLVAIGGFWFFSVSVNVDVRIAVPMHAC
jgi:hypothetical protein